MDAEIFADHLGSPRGIGRLADARHRGSAGGAACGDVVEFRVGFDHVGAVEAGFDADGCGALIAACSSAVELVSGVDLLRAATVSTEAISASLGGLSAAKVHAAELACDAVHRALGSLARTAALPADASLRLVAMSGGVDSALAAVLCADEGPVAGVTLELWRDEQTDAAASCCSHVAVRRARSLAHGAGMPHFTLDLRDEFREGVVDPWVSAYSSGVTPNPCVQCNGRVRIEPMVELAVAIGARSLATGHYARLVELGDGRGPLLAAGADPSKDQAYALMRVPGNVLARMEFPLGGMTKTEVRGLARERGIAVADAPDSQDLCFIAGVGRQGFLRRHGGLDETPGPIVDLDGRRIGTHRGHFNHTVGQRKGLAVGGGVPLYVLSTDATSNSVTVGPRTALSTRRVEIVDVDIRRDPSRIDRVRLRHRSRAGAVESVELTADGAVLHLSEDLDRVAPGQVACLLDGETVVGCGTVTLAGA